VPEDSARPGGHRHLANLLLSANEAMEARALGCLREQGFGNISMAHTRLLRFLRRFPEGGRLSQFAEWGGLTQQSAGYIVDFLESQGYVARSPDPTDRRARIITFTDRGRTATALLIGEFDRIESELRAQYGDEYIDSLRAMLEQIGTPWEAGYAMAGPRPAQGRSQFQAAGQPG